MSFLGNGAVNRVNLHSAIETLAQGAGGLFIMVFLLRAGVSVPVALTAQMAIMLGRFMLRPLILPLAKRVGLKGMVILGSVAMALQYPILAEVRGVGPALYALILASAIGNLIYWSTYHAYFAAIGDAASRGGQVGAREALNALVGVVAPILGGWGLVEAGPRITFWAVAGVQLLAAVPLFGAPNVAVAREASGTLAHARGAALLVASDGLFAAGSYYCWVIALFTTLGESLKAYGGAMALAALVGAAFGLMVGRHIDLGHGRRSVLIAYGFSAGVILLRAVSLDTPWMAVTANALGALMVALHMPVLMTPVYNLAKASPCPLRFHMMTEGGWDLGCALGCGLAALIAASGAPLSWGILLALPAAGMAVVMLRRRYP